MRDNQKVVPTLWDDMEHFVLIHMARLDIRDKDADEISAYVFERFARVDPIVPAETGDGFWACWAALTCDAISAAQRLFAAKWGRMPGRLIDDWPPTPKRFEHPFLIALQQEVAEIEAEATAAEGK